MKADLTPAAMPGGVRLRPAPLDGGEGQQAESERTSVIDLTVCTPAVAGAPLRVRRLHWTEAEPKSEEKPVSLTSIRVWQAARRLALHEDSSTPQPRPTGRLSRLLRGGIYR